MSQRLQYGGGKCKLCKSPGTNMKTCPLNSEATSVNINKHPLALSALSSTQPPIPAERTRPIPAPRPRPAERTRPIPAPRPAPRPRPRPAERTRPIPAPRPRTRSRPSPVQSEKPSTWVKSGTVIYRLPEVISTNKLALYDMDGTLIDSNMEPIMHSIEHLRSHYENGYFVCLISNQYGIKKGHRTEDDVKNIYDLIANYLAQHGIDPKNLGMIFSLEKDYYRKPLTGMFDLLIDQLGINPEKIDMSSSFYCGDAAGRKKSTGKKADHSPADYYFAHNIGLPFLIAPELVVGNKLPNPKFQPTDRDIIRDTTLLNIDPSLAASKLLIMMIGPQGAGKSYLSEILAEQYRGTILSKDLHKSKMDKMFNNNIEQGVTVILDNTNPSKDKREQYLSKAIDHGYQCVAIFFKITKDLSIHLSHMRAQLGGKWIPPVARHTYYKHLEHPSPQEGFRQIITLDGFYVGDGDVPKEYYYWYHIGER